MVNLINDNVLICTDTYKLGHMIQFNPGTTEITSYLQARRAGSEVVWFGFQYYLLQYLSRSITQDNADEFFEIYQEILGEVPDSVKNKIQALVELGYWPILIKAMPEGEIVPDHVPLMTMVNTRPDFEWVSGFLESLLLKVWNTCSVATQSLDLRKMMYAYAMRTCDDILHLPFQIHDFGYRGTSSEETAALSGMSHLLSFYGTDTVPAVWLAKRCYASTSPTGLSVPASEHSVMCSFQFDGEINGFINMLDVYPTGIVSIVSDTYNLWRVLTEFVDVLYDRITTRDGKVVFRPDSGNQKFIICGNPSAEAGSPEQKGALQLLWDKFGGTVNSKGFKVLNPKVGLIYGDGFTKATLKEVFDEMERLGWASSNLVVGIGGILLQNHSRDDHSFAQKAVSSIVNGVRVPLFKNPITDITKASHKGLITVKKLGPRKFEVKDDCTVEEEQDTYLTPVFKDGKVLKTYSFLEIRDRLAENAELPYLRLAS